MNCFLYREQNPGELVELIFYLFYVFLGIMTPVNIHTERIVKNVTLKNRIIFAIAILVSVFLIADFYYKFFNYSETVLSAFVGISVIYSMLVIMTSKPSLLVLHREKIEKRTAKIFIVLLPLLSILFISNHFLNFLDTNLLDGAIIIPLIVFGLGLSKLLDDIKRLSLFRSDNRLDGSYLSRFGITDREMEVVNLLVKGKTYKEISEVLFISIPTVKSHVTNIYGKMEIRNKVELINLINR